MTSPARLVQETPFVDGRALALPVHGQARWQFLAETSLVLAEAEDLDDVLASGLRALVPWFADVCVIRLRHESSEKRRRIALARPELREVFSRIAPREDSQQGDGEMTHPATWATARFTHFDDDILRRIARDADNLERWRELAPTTGITVPIKHRGHSLGYLHLVTTQTFGRQYRAADVGLACDVVQLLASAVDRALQHERLRGAIASGRNRIRETAHDLRDPLSTISLALSDMLDYPSAALSLSARADRDVRMALRAAERLQRMIQNAVEENSDGASLPRPSRIKIAPLLMALVEECRVRARQAGVSIRLSLAPSLPSLAVSADALSRALANLIGNAIKFTPRGGHVIVKAMVEANALVLSVSDSGRGISEVELLHIFEPRWRAGTDTVGYGLGLSIAKAQVDALGGAIHCTSMPGAGATFRIELPLDR